jgi:hypothetical protein
MTINLKKSLCVNYQWDNKKFLNDQSSYLGIQVLNDPKLAFRYLGFLLSYNMVGSPTAAIIKQKVYQKTEPLRLQRVHPSWALTILSSISLGIVRYYSQLGNVPYSGLSKIETHNNRLAKKAVSANARLPAALISLDKKYMGLSVTLAREVATQSRISILFHSLNSEFELIKDITINELVLVYKQSISLKSQNPLTVTLALMKEMNLSFIQFNSTLNQFETLPKTDHQVNICNPMVRHVTPSSNNTYLIYCDASYVDPDSICSDTVSIRNENKELLSSFTFALPSCESFTITEIITACIAIRNLPLKAKVLIHIDNKTATCMNTKTKCNFAYTKYFWHLIGLFELSVDLEWVKSHSSDVYNRAIDSLCNYGRKYGLPDYVNIEVLKSFPNRFFLACNSSLAPNLKKIVHEFYQKKLREEEINPIWDVVKSPEDYSHLSHLSLVNWKSSFSKRHCRTLIKARTDEFCNRDWQLQTIPCRGCGEIGSIKHCCFECPEIVHNIQNVKQQIQEELIKEHILTPIHLFWEDTNLKMLELDFETTLPIGMRGMIPKESAKIINHATIIKMGSRSTSQKKPKNTCAPRLL